MWFICAKIQFESNSQRVLINAAKVSRCGLSVRRYNLKAIHNDIPTILWRRWGVVYLCEDTIWKQFTTPVIVRWYRVSVWFICAKIQFESNSQLFVFLRSCFYGCGLSVRRYNLKAIHNTSQRRKLQEIGVVYLCEDTIWKQFTTHVRQIKHFRGVVYLCEDTIWKQFTTWSMGTMLSGVVWFICAKIQFESNSQLGNIQHPPAFRCGLSVRRYNLKAIHNSRLMLLKVRRGVVYLCEDTIWKQFTTDVGTQQEADAVWFICAKIQFESNSQPADLFGGDWVGCGLSVRRYNLKAIHNALCFLHPF